MYARFVSSRPLANVNDTNSIHDEVFYFNHEMRSWVISLKENTVIFTEKMFSRNVMIGIILFQTEPEIDDITSRDGDFILE